MAPAIRRLLAFERLGLKDTYFETLEPKPQASASRAHQYLGQVDTWAFDPSFDLYGGGGLVSTLADVSKFLRPLLRGEVFHDKATLAAALTTPDVLHNEGAPPHAPLLVAMPFGRRLCWGHGGFWGSLALYCPDADITVVANIDQAEPKTPGQLRDLMAEVAQVLDGLTETRKRASAAPVPGRP